MVGDKFAWNRREATKLLKHFMSLISVIFRCACVFLLRTVRYW